jgi:hypothetical protein
VSGRYCECSGLSRLSGLFSLSGSISHPSEEIKENLTVEKTEKEDEDIAVRNPCRVTVGR